MASRTDNLSAGVVGRVGISRIVNFCVIVRPVVAFVVANGNGARKMLPSW